MKKIFAITILMSFFTTGFSQIESDLQLESINQKSSPVFILESKFNKLHVYIHENNVYAIDCKDNEATQFTIEYTMLKSKSGDLAVVDGRFTSYKGYPAHWYIKPSADDATYVHILTQSGSAITVGQQVNGVFELVLRDLNSKNNDDQKWKLVRVK